MNSSSSPSSRCAQVHGCRGGMISVVSVFTLESSKEKANIACRGRHLPSEARLIDSCKLQSMHDTISELEMGSVDGQDGEPCV